LECFTELAAESYIVIFLGFKHIITSTDQKINKDYFGYSPDLIQKFPQRPD
jgi:hypothetical protein